MRLAHARRGSGPPLLVIHQLDPTAFWERAEERLAREHEVLSVDLPGFGDSPLLPGGQRPTAPALAEAVASWLGSLGLERPAVVGNSLGGAVALELAKRRAVAAAVAISPVGFWSPREAARTLAMLRVFAVAARMLSAHHARLARSPLLRTLLFGPLVARPWRMTPDAARGALRSMATSAGFEPTRRELLRYSLEGPGPEDIPVTLAWAAKDRITPLRQARRAAERFPHATLVTLDGCGHAAMVDAPDQVAHVVQETLTRCAQ